MANNTFTISLREGATYRTTFKWTTRKRVPIDLTGTDIRIEFRDVPDGTLLLTLTEANTGLVVTPLLGQVDMVLTAAQTEAINFATAVWDMRVEFVNGDVVYPVGGKVKVTRSVTEAAE